MRRSKKKKEAVARRREKRAIERAETLLTMGKGKFSTDGRCPRCRSKQVVLTSPYYIDYTCVECRWVFVRVFELKYRYRYHYRFNPAIFKVVGVLE